MILHLTPSAESFFWNYIIFRLSVIINHFSFHPKALEEAEHLGRLSDVNYKPK